MSEFTFSSSVDGENEELRLRAEFRKKHPYLVIGVDHIPEHYLTTCVAVNPRKLYRIMEDVYVRAHIRQE